VSDVLATRYASKEMIDLWSDDTKYKTWRTIWFVIAKLQKQLGVNMVTQEKVEALWVASQTPINYGKVAEYEQRFRHDVMAHIHALADDAPEAKDIIHLGATSCDVTDNADLILMRNALRLIRSGIAAILQAYIPKIKDWSGVPCLGYTHYQPAQLTTVGKRFSMWASDLIEDLGRLDEYLKTMKLRGLKGATGTQASYAELVGKDKVVQLDSQFARHFDFGMFHWSVGQTYPRKEDFQVIALLAGIAQSAHKFATDIRLLQHDGELEEPFDDEQVGSSAMPYKRNPMRSERICGLARYVMNLLPNTLDTAATQWLERTLDDSSNRRLVIPQAFLATDGLLRIYHNIISNLWVNDKKIAASVDAYLPFMVSEQIILRAVKAGWGTRDQAHKKIRDTLTTVLRAMREGRQPPTWSCLCSDFNREIVYGTDLKEIDPHRLVGMSKEQAESVALTLGHLVEGRKFPWDDQLHV